MCSQQSKTKGDQTNDNKEPIMEYTMLVYSASSFIISKSTFTSLKKGYLVGPSRQVQSFIVLPN